MVASRKTKANMKMGQATALVLHSPDAHRVLVSFQLSAMEGDGIAGSRWTSNKPAPT